MDKLICPECFKEETLPKLLLEKTRHVDARHLLGVRLSLEQSSR